MAYSAVQTAHATPLYSAAQEGNGVENLIIGENMIVLTQSHNALL